MNITEDKASIVIVTYNSRRYLKSCIESIMKQDYPFEIIIVDNCSTDGTIEFMRENFPSIKLIESKKNKGYGAGNNLGVKFAKGKYLVVVNPDTVVEGGWLRELIKPLKYEMLVTTSKILMYDGSMINTCGIINHFTGLPFTKDLGAKANTSQKSEYLSGFSGCCFAMRVKDFIELGGFDENFFMYNDDTDLAWRLHLKGFKILFVPTSIVKHDYTLKVAPKKLYHLEKGRYIILRKYLSFKYFLLLSPSLIIVEFLTFGYAIKFGLRGWIYKCKAIKDGFNARVSNVKGDRYNLFKSLNATIPIDQLTSNEAERTFISIANKIFRLNLKVMQ